MNAATWFGPRATQPFRFLLMVSALSIPLALSSCGEGDQTTITTTTTTGQELGDLKKALDDGAITQEQYEIEQKKILERSN